MATSFLATPAFAQERFGKSGTLAVSAERLFGLLHTSTTTEDDDGDVSTTSSWTGISLLANRADATGGAYSTARIGGDYFVIDGLSVGAALGFFTASNSVEVESDDMSVEEDGPSLSGFLLAPRVGYAFMFTPVIGLWPRGGLTWAHASQSNGDDTVETTINRTALTLEVPLVIAPVPHVAFLVAPTLDIGLGGGFKTDRDAPTPDTELDAKTTEFGIQGAMTVYF